MNNGKVTQVTTYNTCYKNDNGERNMPNEKGWYTKEEVLETGLPCYISDNKDWTFKPYDFAVLLSESRCKKFEIPILSSGREMPSAFRCEKVNHYYPLYDRTDVFASGELNMKDLYDYEIMGGIEDQYLRRVKCNE